MTGESLSGGGSLPVNLLGNGSGGASSGGQASACAGEERPSLFSDSGNRLPHFNPFATAFASLGPAERYEAEFMGASEFLNRRLNEEFQRAFEVGCICSALTTGYNPSTRSAPLIVPIQRDEGRGKKAT